MGSCREVKHVALMASGPQFDCYAKIHKKLYCYHYYM